MIFSIAKNFDGISSLILFHRFVKKKKKLEQRLQQRLLTFHTSNDFFLFQEEEEKLCKYCPLKDFTKNFVNENCLGH